MEKIVENIERKAIASDVSASCGSSAVQSASDAAALQDLPPLLSIGLECMKLDAEGNYSQEKILEAAHQAYRRYPTHHPDITLTSAWLMCENICKCREQKNALREIFALAVRAHDDIQGS